MESMGKKPRQRRSFTPEFKAEIVELCQRGDWSVGHVASDFDLTETSVREWVKQAEPDAGTRRDGGNGVHAGAMALSGRGPRHRPAGQKPGISLSSERAADLDLAIDIATSSC